MVFAWEKVVGRPRLATDNFKPDAVSKYVKNSRTYITCAMLCFIYIHTYISYYKVSNICVCTYICIHTLYVEICI